MNRSIVNTVDAMLKLIPDGEPLKQRLESWKGSVFLELPEDNSHLWREVGRILSDHWENGPDCLLDWERAIVGVWAGKIGAESRENRGV